MGNWQQINEGYLYSPSHYLRNLTFKHNAFISQRYCNLLYIKVILLINNPYRYDKTNT
jgi:hypothetical protein